MSPNDVIITVGKLKRPFSSYDFDFTLTEGAADSPYTFALSFSGIEEAEGAFNQLNKIEDDLLSHEDFDGYDSFTDVMQLTTTLIMAITQMKKLCN